MFFGATPTFAKMAGDRGEGILEKSPHVSPVENVE